MTTSPRSRLSSAVNDSPWIRAIDNGMLECSLFWLPVSDFPLRHDETVWLTHFLVLFGSHLVDDLNLRCETFLQYRVIAGQLIETFQKFAQEARMLPGLGRRGQEPLPKSPDPEQIQRWVLDGKKIDHRDWMADYLIWFSSKNVDQQRKLFMGYGGMITMFLRQDPRTTPPKILFTPKLRAAMPAFQKLDVDGTIASAFAMGDAFLDKSKRLFGAGLENTTEWNGLAFILPLLGTEQFLQADSRLRAAWFDLFDVYINESKADKGLVLAFARPEIERVFHQTLQELRDMDIRYPGHDL